MMNSSRFSVLGSIDGESSPPCGLARRHWAVGVSAASSEFLIHLPASLRSRPVTALPRSYGRSDSCSLRPGSARALPSGHRFGSPRAGLPDSRTRPSDHSVSNHLRTLRLVRARYPSTDRTEIASPRASPNGNSGLRHSLAGSPHHAGRIEFLIVRTGRSPPAAPHPVSPRRSCRLITSYVDLERTFTPPTRCALRRTSAGVSPAVSGASRSR